MASSLADRYTAFRRQQKTAGLFDIGKKLISSSASKAAPAAAAKLPGSYKVRAQYPLGKPLKEYSVMPGFQTGGYRVLGDTWKAQPGSRMPNVRNAIVPVGPSAGVPAGPSAGVPTGGVASVRRAPPTTFPVANKAPGSTPAADKLTDVAKRLDPPPASLAAFNSATLNSSNGLLANTPKSTSSLAAFNSAMPPKGLMRTKATIGSGFDAGMATAPKVAPAGSLTAFNKALPPKGPLTPATTPLAPKELGSISQSAKQLLRPAGLMAAGGAGLIGADAMFGGKPNSMTGVPPLLSSADTNRGVPFINGAPSVNNGGPTTQGRPPLLSAEDTTGVPPLLSAEDTTSGFPSINNGAPATPGMPSPGGPAGPPRLPPVAGDMSPQPPESQSGVPGVPGALGGPDPSKLTRSQYPAAKDPAAAAAQDMAAEVTAESGGWTADVMKWISGMLPEWAAKPLSQLTEAVGPTAMVFGVPLGLLGVYMMMKTMMGKSGASQSTTYKLSPMIAKRTEFGKFLPANGTVKLKK